MSKIDFFYDDIKPFKFKKMELKRFVNLLISKELKKSGQISIVFCSDEYLLDMNKKYLNHDYYTDIITFNNVDGDLISGDLFVSIDRVKDNAKKFKTEWIHELYRVVFHGVLHLIGYNDKTQEEQVMMRQKEDFYLSEVGFSEIEL